MGGGIAACAIAIALAACVNSEYDGRTDTVYSLDTPSVTAKAYPGVNVVSWKPVAGASSYNVTVYEEGAYKRGGTASGNSLTDTDLVNGKKYTYYVEAMSASNPGTAAREVYATNSRGEASVTAIVPPAGTSALELPAYEGGYNGSLKEVKDDKFVVSAENVDVTVDKGNVYVNIPTKAYLSYNVNIFDTDLSREIVGITPVNGTSVSDTNSNNVTLTKQFTVSSAGKYKIVVKVSAYNGIYKDSEVEAGEIEIATLDLDYGSGTGAIDYDTKPTAEYLSDGKTARISFTPAQKNSVNVPTGWYKVYRRVNGEYATTLVSGTVKESVGTATKYYIDDEIADKTKVYEYIVVVENDGKYGKAKKADLNIETGLVFDEDDYGRVLGTSNVIAEYLYNVNHFASDADNTVRISFTPAKKDGKAVPTSWYKVYRNESGKLDQTEITSATNKIMLDDKDSGAYVIYDVDKSIDPAKSYVYTVVVENDGKTGTPEANTLSARTKPTFTVQVNSSSEVLSVYNNIEWTIYVEKSNASNIKAYLLETKSSQVAPTANEVLAKGTELTTLAKVSGSSTNYTVTKNNVADGVAYVVVTATCDGYENAISSVYPTSIIKH